jgi:hypothetical protein
MAIPQRVSNEGPGGRTSARSTPGFVTVRRLPQRLRSRTVASIRGRALVRSLWERGET